MAKQKTVGGTILKIVLGIVIVVVLFVVGFFLIAKYAIGVDIIGAYKGLKKLGTTVDTQTIITYPYETNEAMADSLNSIIELKTGETNIVTSSGGEITIDTQRFENLLFDSSLELTDKQLACIINVSFDDYTNALDEKVANGLKDVELSQIQFGSYQEEGGVFKSVNMELVVKLPLENIKQYMTGFPLSLLKDMLPNELYIKTNLKITKDNTSAWKYSILAKDTTFNNMTKEDSNNLIKSISGFLGASDADELGYIIGEYVVNTIIGNSEQIGFGSGLLQARDFTFKNIGNKIYYVIEFMN